MFGTIFVLPCLFSWPFCVCYEFCLFCSFCFWLGILCIPKIESSLNWTLIACLEYYWFCTWWNIICFVHCEMLFVCTLEFLLIAFLMFTLSRFMNSVYLVMYVFDLCISIFGDLQAIAWFSPRRASRTPCMAKGSLLTTTHLCRRPPTFVFIQIYTWLWMLLPSLVWLLYLLFAVLVELSMYSLPLSNVLWSRTLFCFWFLYLMVPSKRCWLCVWNRCNHILIYIEALDAADKFMIMITPVHKTMDEANTYGQYAIGLLISLWGQIFSNAIVLSSHMYFLEAWEQMCF